jgi:hypothetical protein
MTRPKGQRSRDLIADALWFNENGMSGHSFLFLRSISEEVKGHSNWADKKVSSPSVGNSLRRMRLMFSDQGSLNLMRKFHRAAQRMPHQNQQVFPFISQRAYY